VVDLPPGSNPLSITLGPDGNLWFADHGTNAIERMTPEGALTSFPTPTQFSAPSGLTNGPDGRLWFPERSPPAKIGSIEPGASDATDQRRRQVSLQRTPPDPRSPSQSGVAESDLSSVGRQAHGASGRRFRLGHGATQSPGSWGHLMT
jgi:streptogramin lyase